MSKISYTYKTPIPMIFWRNGALDPSKKIYKNRLAFLTFAFSKCYWDRFEFNYSREEASLKSGLTIQELRTQEEYFIETGFLIKRTNFIHDRILTYYWDEERFSEEKIIFIEEPTSQNKSQVSENNEDKACTEKEVTSQTEKQQVKQQVEQQSRFSRGNRKK